MSVSDKIAAEAEEYLSSIDHDYEVSIDHAHTHKFIYVTVSYRGKMIARTTKHGRWQIRSASAYAKRAIRDHRRLREDLAADKARLA